jgi:hypothetical protein
MKKIVVLLCTFYSVLISLFAQPESARMKTLLINDKQNLATIISLKKLAQTDSRFEYWYVLYLIEGAKIGYVIKIKDYCIQQRLITYEGDEDYSYLFVYKDSILEKQIEQFHVKPRTVFIHDFNGDGSDDILFFESSGVGIMYQITTVDTVHDTLKDLLSIEKPYYEPFCPFEFIVYNGRRGIKVDDSYEIKEQYNEYGVEQPVHPKWSFYYWDREAGKYVKDKNVAAGELAAIHGSPDFFADTGLDYSRLGRLLTKEDVLELTKAQLRIYRNAVYARHGRSFQSPDLQALFNGYDWYKKNPAYTDGLLTETDRKNIKILQGME